MNLCYPLIDRKSLGSMLKLSGFGALIAGVYGIVHDQVTFSLSREYFTRFKFYQFEWADFGLGDRFFVGTIGFLATWWVGAIAGWVLGRIAAYRGGSREHFGMALRQFPVILIVAAAFGVSGYLNGSIRIYREGLETFRTPFGFSAIENTAGFLRVGFIHNFGYIGAAIGLILAGILSCRKLTSQKT